MRRTFILLLLLVAGCSNENKSYNFKSNKWDTFEMGKLSVDTAPPRARVYAKVRCSGVADFKTPQGDATHAMSLMVEESFGPIVGVASVKDDAEALARMNDSPYGLSAAVWTSSRERAERMGRALQVGTVFMNRCDYLDPALPWVGVKDSGLGFTLSRHGLLAFTRPKSFHLRLATR